MQYNVNFTLKTIRNFKSNTVNGRTNQQSKGGEAHLENNLRMSRSRMNLIRENSRLGIEEPISIRAPSNKRRRERKQHQQTTQDIKKQNARQPATSRQKPHMWAGAVKEPGQTGEDRIHWTIIMTTLFFLALSRLVFLFAKLL